MEAQSNIRLFEWLASGQDTGWKALAACKGLGDAGTALFFPSGGADAYESAKALCERCSVAAECDAYNEEFERAINWRSGCYGGTTPKERELRHRLVIGKRRVTDAEETA